MRYIIILLFVSSQCFGQCSHNVYDIATNTYKIIPCTQEEILQRQIDDSLWQVQTITDSITLSDNNFALATIIQTAKSAEGVAYNQLTASQIRALVAILLFKEKAIEPKTLVIRPLTTWIK